LTVINGYSDMLIKDLPEGDPQRQAIEESAIAGERAGPAHQAVAHLPGRRRSAKPRPLDSTP